MPKDAFIPKTTVESKYREKIDRAVAYRRAHGEPDLTISQWIRQACAELAKYDLEDALAEPAEAPEDVYCPTCWKCHGPNHMVSNRRDASVCCATPSTPDQEGVADDG